MDRKRYSKTREDRLYQIVDQTITNLRLDILRGHLSGQTANRQEELVWKALCDLPDRVVNEYRRSYAPETKEDQPS